MFRLVRRIVVGVVALVVLYFAVTFVQVWNASRSDHAGKAQAIVVLGAAQYDGKPSPVLRARLDHAIDLWNDGVAPLIVTTGGNQPGDRFTEASAAASYLISNGVPEEALELESQGSSSWESLAAAARFLRKQGITDVVLVSSPYHALRTEQIAGEVGLHGRASPALETESTSRRLYHLARETLAVGIGRIVGHRRLVDLDARDGGDYPGRPASFRFSERARMVASGAVAFCP
jgi:vancomycin permeability regulator SanA